MSKLTLLWKIYFWIFSFVIIISIFFINSGSKHEWIMVSLDIVGLIGLFGFAYQKRILSNIFWRGWWVAAVANEILFIATSGKNFISVTSVITLILIFPMYVALFIYAFGCKYILSSHSDTSPEP